MVTHNDEIYEMCIWDLSIATDISAELTNIQNEEVEKNSNQRIPLIKTFDYPSNAKTIKLKGHQDEVNCVRFLLPLVISGSADKTIRIWKIDKESFQQCYDESDEELGICLRVLTGT